jgi:hypothetical protein
MSWIIFLAIVVVLAQPVMWAAMIALWVLAVRTQDRVEELEKAAARLPWPAPAPAPRPAPRAQHPPVEAVAQPAAPVGAAAPLKSDARPRVEPVVGAAGRQPAPAPPQPPLPAPAFTTIGTPAPTPAAPRRDWEAAVGGNWLNKAGVALLVIGIALLLGYSFHRLDAVGRVAMGVAGGTALLAAGIWSERREAYRTFGHGLVGGGWAALYFTAFAAHAVPAARVVESAAGGSALLGAAAVAMIADSLRYRSQTVTGLAYFLGFIALGVSELSGYALAASVPLAASVLFLSRRYGWRAMARAIVPTAYALFVVHALQARGGDPLAAQTLVLIYWALFEGFELLDAPDVAMQTLNAVCFVPCAYLIWSGRGPDAWLAPAIAAGVFACSALVRSIRRPQTLGYQAAAALAAGFCAIGVLSKLSGFAAASALLIEGEVVWVLGFALRQRYLRALGAAVLGVWAVHFAAIDLADPRLSVIAFHDWRIWTPMAAAACTLFLLNRMLVPAARYYTYAAAALLALITGAEVPAAWVGVTWLALAAVAGEFGVRKAAPDLVHVAAGLGALSLAAFAWRNLIETPAEWGPQLCGALMLLAAAVRSPRLAAQRAGSIAGAVLGCACLAQVLPSPYVAVGQTLFGVALAEGALLARVPSLGSTGHGVALAAFARLLAVNFDEGPRLLTAAPVAAAHYWLFARSAGLPGFRRVYLYTAALAMALLLHVESAHPFRSVAWAAGMLVYLWAGRCLALWDLRVQGYALGAAALARFAVADLGKAHVTEVGAAVAAALFAAYFLARREESTTDRAAAHAAPVAGALAVGLLLWDRVSGGMLTMAWGVEGLALLAGGFAARARVLRLTGLAALAVCVLKLFFYDLRNLDTPYRIASFLVLGALLIAVSWAYTRFRAELERYL